MKIQADLLKAAILASAKKDVRYYLNGIMLDGKSICATDGHLLFTAPFICDLEKETIISFDSSIQAFKGECTIDLEALTVTDGKRIVKIEIVDGKYPDVSRVIPKDYARGDNVKQSPRVQGHLLERVGKITALVGGYADTFVRSDSDSVVFELSIPKDGKNVNTGLIVLMPCKK
jgi:hypothetical protein